MLLCIRRETVAVQKNQAGQIASIQSIHRYLVKSMAGEAVERCYLTESGLYGDRLYAFESSGAPAGMLRLTGRERREMLRYQPLLRSDGRVEVRVPAGEQFLVDSPAMLAYLATHTPEASQIHPHPSAPPQTDVRPLSLISVQTVRQLSTEMGQVLDPRRFRANLYLDLPAARSWKTASLGELSASGRRQRFSFESETRAAVSLLTILRSLWWQLLFFR